MPRPPTPVHYLRGNKREFTPRHVAYFDTETVEVKSGDDLHLSLRCWDFAVIDRHPEGESAPSWRWYSGETSSALADAIEQAAPPKVTLWTWAHNLGFDVTVTALPDVMIGRGWELTDFQLSETSSFFTLRKGSRRVILCDSFSWLPTSLERIAKALGGRKVDLPGNDDELQTWHKRCRVDVKLLARAMLAVLDYWESNGLGNFGVTGASCGWNAARHLGLGDQVLIDPDPDVRAFERGAIYGGRREAWRVGRVEGSRFLDRDIAGAYPTTAGHYLLPTRRTGEFHTLALDHAWMRSPYHTVIADCEVTTQVPVAPVRFNGHVCYPVGKFITRLTRPEIQLVTDCGGSVRILHGYAYRTGPVLKPWADWILGLMNAPRGDVPAVVQIMLKHWSRAVIGRFAARTSRMVDEGPAIWPTFHVADAMDSRTGQRLELITAGGRQMTMLRDVDTDNCFPAILAVVEGYTRVALWRLVDSRPPGSVWQMDTDGWLERSDYVRGTDPSVSVPRPYRVAIKGVYGRVEVLGPNHLQLDADRRFAGISRDAEMDDEGIFRSNIWPGLRWQLRQGSPGRYVRPLRKAKIIGPYTMRIVLADGTTEPLRVDYIGGRNVVLPLPQSTWIGESVDSAIARQHPVIRDLISDGQQQTLG